MRTPASQALSGVGCITIVSRKANYTSKSVVVALALFEKHLIVKKSGLPNSGKGLFTKKDIPKGTRIVEYKGRIQRWHEVKDQDGINGYLMYINRHVVINALPALKTLGRYANDARGLVRMEGIRNNSEYVSEGKRCYIEATRNIQAGQEIFVNYGREYWSLMKRLTAEK